MRESGSEDEHQVGGADAAAALQTPAGAASGETRAAHEIELALRTALADRYVVERLIGRGGMATVYLARDLRHERRVALKVLDRELGAVLGVERFLGEIRVTANLQHPNILPLFDSGEVDGLLFYVTPYIEGESLRARLTRERQLPVDEAVRLAVGVAGALQYAHRQGVIHRDLKPDNILLLEGQPLLADFGIALAVSNAGGERVTQTGLSLGTPQYMSPEQATADQYVDGRSDIYSLAAVLYEMLTGDPPHSGSTARAVIARVITERPRPVRATRESVPPHVAASVERALAKIPADRFASAQDFADALQGRGVLHAEPRATGSAAGAGPTRRDPWVYVLGALALAASVVAGVLWRGRTPEVREAPPVRFVLDFPAGEGPVEGFGASYAISPDGRRIVYGGRAGNESMLYMRPLDQLAATPIPGTEGAVHAAFSADGRWLAFATRTELRKLPVAGGTASTLASGLRMSLGLTWVGSERIVFVMGGALMSVPSTGGTPAEVVPAPAGGAVIDRGWPISLGSAAVVFAEWVRDSLATSQLVVADLELGTKVPLGVSGSVPLGMVGQELVYGTSSGTIMAVPLDDARRAVQGVAAPLLDGVLTAPPNALRAAASASGSLMYVRGTRDREIVEVGARGSLTPTGLRAGSYSYPRLSPDGRRLAVVIQGSVGEELRVYDLSTGAATVLANGTRFAAPSWGRDGRRIVFATRGRDSVTVWRRAADGSGSAERLATLRGAGGAVVASPDGRWILFSRPPRGPDVPGGLWYVAVRGDTTPVLLAASDGAPMGARFSADGRRVAYASGESGVSQVYVRDFPGPGGAIQVSLDGGTQPSWSADGARLYYRNGNAILEATFGEGGSLAVQSRSALVGAEDDVPDLMDVEAASAGSRVVALRDAGRGPTLVVVHDWWTEARRRLRVQRAQ